MIASRSLSAIMPGNKKENKMADLQPFLARLRPEVIDAMKDLKKKTRIAMSIHCEQFLIDGLKRYGIRVEDYEDKNGSE
jgi:hypothetical protein